MITKVLRAYQVQGGFSIVELTKFGTQTVAKTEVARVESIEKAAELREVLQERIAQYQSLKRC
jgi:hypothetical protein